MIKTSSLIFQNILWGHRPEIPGSTSTSSLSDLQLLYLHHLLDSCSIFSYTEFRKQMSKVSCGTEEENQARYGSRECGELPPNFMSELCQKHDTVVLKTIRIRDIRVLSEIFRIGGHDVKVIHLLRDPRGVVNSRRRFSHFYLRDLEEVPVEPLTKRKVARAAHDYCDHEHDNLRFLETKPGWLRGNYLKLHTLKSALIQSKLWKECISF